MSRNYDNWEKLVGAVLRREKDRQLAYCESFSSLGSADVSLRPSSASDVPADPSAHGIFASHSIMIIPFEELRLATQNFQPDVLLGEGKFGPVFKGQDFNPKLSNFCLAIDGPTGDKTHVESRVMSPYGYAAPEYVATGNLTTGCDVYGFGVVLLERFE